MIWLCIWCFCEMKLMSSWLICEFCFYWCIIKGIDSESFDCESVYTGHAASLLLHAKTRHNAIEKDLIYLVYLITITSERQVSTLMKYSLIWFVVVPRIAGKYIMDTCTQTKTETELHVSFHPLIIRKRLREIKETGIFYLQHVLRHFPVDLGVKQRKTLKEKH